VFRAELSETLKRIFSLKKATFDAPSESAEQDCLFIEVERALTSAQPPYQRATVSGKIRVYSTTDKLPYGYFSKKIQEADAEDTRNFFFHSFEENSGRLGNLCERTISFVYFYRGQYDPDQGEITSLNTTYPEN
jgi:hypothetical protein